MTQNDHPAGTGRQRLGVDFCTGNTVVAMRDESGVIHLQDFPGWSRPFPSGVRERPVPRVPSQILYSDTGTRSIGAAELPDGTKPAGVARGLRYYILENSTVQVPAGGGCMKGYRNAGSDFLTALLTHAPCNSTGTAEVVFSVPVDAPCQYSAWLRAVAMVAGFRVPFVIDEPCAAVAGYGLYLSPGALFLLIDFHADGLDISLITQEEFSDDTRGICSHILGNMHDNTGGLGIDGWIVQDVLNRNRLDETDSRVAPILPLIRFEAGRVREALVLDREVMVQVADPVSGFSLRALVSRSDLCRILEERGLFVAINRAFDRVLSAGGIRGEGEERIEAVLMIGECSAIPCIQDAVKQRWGPKVHCNHPVDAIARGTAMANPKNPESNRIRNDYAIRHWDPGAREYRYRFIVRNGARYPSAGQVARFIISGAYDGQAYLGIPLCEISTAGHDPHGHIELVSNDRGGVQIAGPAPDPIPAMRPVVVNESEPTLLHASPPAQKGEPRFELTFFLDRQGYLCLTARDLLTGLLVKQDTQVFRLN